ncbi:MAG: PspC domain-containing protein [Bacteroidaceae bacterium]|nr:PspC domain-containing protein [Bacteroidaceae bacterium]
MKKSFNVNLGGRIFQIDEDAYEQLNDYLVSVRTCFMNNECGEEIAADIEQRMGELFESRMNDGLPRIVTLSLVNEMIARMGKPESMVDENESVNASATETDNSASDTTEEDRAGEDTNSHASMGKKLFRDGERKLLGGVVSGFAAYFDLDVTLLRVVTVFLFFITAFWTFLLYLVLWAVLPLAITTTDKLRMKGVEPTPENIAEKLAYEEPAIDKIMRNIKEVDNNGISNLLVILGCVLFLSLFVFGVACDTSMSRMLYLSLIFCWIGTISILAIPIVAIVLVLSKKWQDIGSGVKWLLLIVWILALVQVPVILSNL